MELYGVLSAIYEEMGEEEKAKEYLAKAIAIRDAKLEGEGSD